MFGAPSCVVEGTVVISGDYVSGLSGLILCVSVFIVVWFELLMVLEINVLL